MGQMVTEEKRAAMAVGAAALCFLCLGPSVALVAAGGYAKTQIEAKIRLIESFDTAALPGVILFLGLYCIIHNAASGAVLFQCRRPKKREGKMGLLTAGVVFGTVLFTTLFVMSLVSFGQTFYLEKMFDKGIIMAMKSYKKDKLLKVEIDCLQVDFRCCGNDKYTDWFKISWIKEEYVNSDRRGRDIQQGGYKNDDVPFSCCDTRSPRPCINHHVHDNDMHYNYDYRVNTTLYEMGCRESLVTFYGKQLMNLVGFILLGVGAQQLTVVLLTRYFQTSAAAALELGDPEATTLGYIFSPKVDEEKEEGKEEGKDGEGEAEPLLAGDEEPPQGPPQAPPEPGGQELPELGEDDYDVWGSDFDDAEDYLHGAGAGPAADPYGGEENVYENLYDDGPGSLGIPTPPPPPPISAPRPSPGGGIPTPPPPPPIGGFRQGQSAPAPSPPAPSGRLPPPPLSPALRRTPAREPRPPPPPFAPALRPTPPATPKTPTYSGRLPPPPVSPALRSAPPPQGGGRVPRAPPPPPIGWSAKNRNRSNAAWYLNLTNNYEEERTDSGTNHDFCNNRGPISGGDVTSIGQDWSEGNLNDNQRDRKFLHGRGAGKRRESLSKVHEWFESHCPVTGEEEESNPDSRGSAMHRTEEDNEQYYSVYGGARPKTPGSWHKQ